MKYIFLIAGMCFLYSCRTYNTASSRNAADTLVRIISWGLPNFSMAAAESKLAAQWGFYFDNVGSCTASQTEVDSFEAYNKIAERPLVARHGKNWNKRFWDEFIAATATPEQSYVLFHYNDVVSSKREELALAGDTLFYHFLPTKHRGIYNVEIVGWDRQGTQKEWVSFFRYHVNYLESRATLTRKKKKVAPSYLTGNSYFSRESFTMVPR